METKAVAVLGGGISGLAALHVLRRSPASSSASIKLYDRLPRVGGWLNTGRKQISDKGLLHMYEKGPRSIRSAGNGLLTLGLISQLNLAPHLIYPSSASAKRFLYLSGKVTALPSSPLEAVMSPSLLKYAPGIASDLLAFRTPSNNDESIASFFERHFGKSLTREIVGGVVVGIYGGNMDKLSIAACFPTLVEAARAQNDSLMRGLLLGGSNKSKELVDQAARALHMDQTERKHFEETVAQCRKNGAFNFDEGMALLPSTLAALHQQHIETEATITGISKTSTSGLDILVRDSQGRTSTAQNLGHIICSLPAHELAPLLRDISPKASLLLSEIEFIDMAVVSLAYEEQAGQQIIPTELKGFGYLVPPLENRGILGVAFDSITFPVHSKPNVVRMAVMIGGDPTNNPNAIDLSKITNPDDLIAIARRHLQEDIGIFSDPISVDVSIARKAIPQYTVGHLERVAQIEASLKQDAPNIHLAGASYYGVSVNDCVASGFKAALGVESRDAPRTNPRPGAMLGQTQPI